MKATPFQFPLTKKKKESKEKRNADFPGMISQGSVTCLNSLYEMGIHLLHIISLKLFLRSKGQILLFSME